jgi:hypothetical protein
MPTPNILATALRGAPSRSDADVMLPENRAVFVKARDVDKLVDSESRISRNST